MIQPHFYEIRHALLPTEVNNYITVALKFTIKVIHAPIIAASIDLQTTT